MQILTNKNLQKYNTFGIPAIAKNFLIVENYEDDFLDIVRDQDFFILGGGSNILFGQDFLGFIIKNNIKGIDKINETDKDIYLKVAGGERWQDLVDYCIKSDLGGIENLSLIPGTVGASPVQNIGAYGVELKDVFVELTAIDLKTGKRTVFQKEDCKFDYRFSIFKTPEYKNFFILDITIKLTKQNHHIFHTEYGDIESTLSRLNLEKSVKNISDAVIEIRKSKLPDPATLPNAGSFFKNPIIPKIKFMELQTKHPAIPSYPVSDDLVKVPAGWLIDQAGLKGFSLGTASVHEKQALVIINKGDGKDILKLADYIIEKVSTIFDIQLEKEVLVV